MVTQLDIWDGIFVSGPCPDRAGHHRILTRSTPEAVLCIFGCVGKISVNLMKAINLLRCTYDIFSRKLVLM